MSAAPRAQHTFAAQALAHPSPPTPCSRRPATRPQDRVGEGSQLLNKPARGDENAQPEHSSQQSLKPHTWQTGSSAQSWIASGAAPPDSASRDEYGFPRNEAPVNAPINTHDFPSLAATAKQGVSVKHQRPQGDQVCTEYCSHTCIGCAAHTRRHKPRWKPVWTT